MIFAVVIWFNNAPSLAAAHHRASPCRFGIAPAYDNTHKPLMLNPRRANLMEANLLEVTAATSHKPEDRHQPKLAHRH